MISLKKGSARVSQITFLLGLREEGRPPRGRRGAGKQLAAPREKSASSQSGERMGELRQQPGAASHHWRLPRSAAAGAAHDSRHCSGV